MMWCNQRKAPRLRNLKHAVTLHPSLKWRKRDADYLVHLLLALQLGQFDHQAEKQVTIKERRQEEDLHILWIYDFIELLNEKISRVCVCVLVVPSQEVVLIRVFIEQLDLQVLPRVIVYQGLETQEHKGLTHSETDSGSARVVTPWNNEGFFPFRTFRSSF